MILVKSNKFLDIAYNADISMQGLFKLEAIKVDSSGKLIEKSRRLVADWFPNIITNQGLNRYATNPDYLGACQVGTGTATPLATDTGLQTRIAGTSNTLSINRSAQGAAPYFGTRTSVFQFATGVAAGNLTEVGIGWSSTGSTLFSRALIVDGGGNPTTVTVLSDEVLEVTYLLRLYPPASDNSSNATITNVGTITVTTRAGLVTASNNWSVGQQGGSAEDMSGVTTGSTDARAWSGSIGAITGEPSGSPANRTSVSNSAYGSNSYFRNSTVTWGLSEGNIGGINSVSLFFGSGKGLGYFQFGFGTTIPKDNTKVLTLNFRYSWSRR